MQFRCTYLGSSRISSRSLEHGWPPGTPHAKSKHRPVGPAARAVARAIAKGVAWYGCNVMLIHLSYTGGVESVLNDFWND